MLNGGTLLASEHDEIEIINRLENLVAAKDRSIAALNVLIESLKDVVSVKMQAIQTLEQHNENLHRRAVTAEANCDDAKLTIAELQTANDLLQARLDASNRAHELASYERAAA